MRLKVSRQGACPQLLGGGPAPSALRRAAAPRLVQTPPRSRNCARETAPPASPLIGWNRGPVASSADSPPHTKARSETSPFASQTSPSYSASSSPFPACTARAPLGTSSVRACAGLRRRSCLRSARPPHGRQHGMWLCCVCSPARSRGCSDIPSGSRAQEGCLHVGSCTCHALMVPLLLK